MQTYVEHLEDRLLAAEAELRALRRQLALDRALLPEYSATGRLPVRALPPKPTGTYRLACGALLDLDDSSLQYRGVPVALSPLEVRILGALACAAGRLESGALAKLSGVRTTMGARQHVLRLREKVCKLGLEPAAVIDSRGKNSGGYRLLLAERLEAVS